MDETKVSETILSSDVQEQTAQYTVNDQEGDMEADVMREAASTQGSRQTVEKQAGDNPPPLTKSQQKRLKQKQKWEEKKESRKKILKKKKKKTICSEISRERSMYRGSCSSRSLS